MECPLPWLKPGQRYVLVLEGNPDAILEVAHLARTSEWQPVGAARTLCGAPARWSMAIDEQGADELPCAICAQRAAISLMS